MDDKKGGEDWISIRDLNVYFGERHSIKGVNIDIPSKKLTAIIGPSGCGKTTLLRCLNRFIDFEPDAKIRGQIIINGQNILEKSVDVTGLRKHVGMLSQRPTPLPMSIFENVAYGPKLHGQNDKAELEKIVREKLEMADLWNEVKDRLDAPATVLSVGQQQRLCLARTLSVEPQIILADEPTSALDPIATEHIEELLMRLKKKYTIVLATHNIKQAKKVSDYVAHIYYGEIVEADWTEKLFGAPKHPRTHAYIHGEQYVEQHIDKTLKFSRHTFEHYYTQAKKALYLMKMGQTLQLICNDRSRAGRVSTGLKSDGHEILRVRKIDEGSWEILVRKAEPD